MLRVNRGITLVHTIHMLLIPQDSPHLHRTQVMASTPLPIHLPLKYASPIFPPTVLLKSSSGRYRSTTSTSRNVPCSYPMLPLWSSPLRMKQIDACLLTKNHALFVNHACCELYTPILRTTTTHSIQLPTRVRTIRGQSRMGMVISLMVEEEGDEDEVVDAEIVSDAVTNIPSPIERFPFFSAGTIFALSSFDLSLSFSLIVFHGTTTDMRKLVFACFSFGFLFLPFSLFYTKSIRVIHFLIHFCLFFHFVIIYATVLPYFGVKESERHNGLGYIPPAVYGPDPQLSSRTISHSPTPKQHTSNDMTVAIVGGCTLLFNS